LVAVTSANAVAALAEALAEQGRPPQLGQTLFAAVGPHTAAALTSRGFAVGLVAGLAGEESSAAGLSRAIAQQLGDGALRPILFLRAAAARPTLVDSLHRAGLVVDDVVAYQMVEATAASLAPLAELLRQGAVDAAPFGSPRTVAIVCTALRAAGCDPVALLGPLRVGAIGTTTAAALRAVGVRVDVVGQSGSFAELIEKLRRLR
jgi:uroporphyrinogen-III synthase